MTGNAFFGFTFFVFVLLAFFVPGEANIEEATDETDLKEIIRSLSKEISILKEEVKKLKERDVESDISDIKRILVNYGEDLTSLRINQGHIVESIDEHSISLANINMVLASNAEKFVSHEHIFFEHQTFMGENRAIIDGHTQIVNNHQGSIQTNIQGIVKNAQNIQAVGDNFSNYKNSQVKFFVATPYGGGEYNPENTRLTFPFKKLDTHNAMSDSQFFAPIGGIYGFVFTADFRMYDERIQPGYIIINVNDVLAKVWMFDSQHDDGIRQSHSIFFLFILNQGDRLDINTSGEPCYDISRNPATLMGYLMQ
jgi:hypothetical protein